MTKAEAEALLAEWRHPGPYTRPPELDPKTMVVAKLTGESIVVTVEAASWIREGVAFVSTPGQSRDKYQCTLVEEAKYDGRPAFMRLDSGEVHPGELLQVVVPPKPLRLEG